MKQGLTQINSYTIAAQPFETALLATTATSAAVTFTTPASIKDYEIVVQNSGTNIAFMAFSSSTSTVGVKAAVVPTSTPAQYCTPILPGAIYTWQKNSDAIQVDTVAAICASGNTTTLYVTTIQGS
jgi:hypothetical protein